MPHLLLYHFGFIIIYIFFQKINLKYIIIIFIDEDRNTLAFEWNSYKYLNFTSMITI